MQQVEDDHSWFSMLQLLRFKELAQAEFTLIDEFVEFSDETEDRGDTIDVLTFGLDELSEPLFGAGTIKLGALLSTDDESSCLWLNRCFKFPLSVSVSLSSKSEGCCCFS